MPLWLEKVLAIGCAIHSTPHQDDVVKMNVAPEYPRLNDHPRSHDPADLFGKKGEQRCRSSRVHGSGTDDPRRSRSVQALQADSSDCAMLNSGGLSHWWQLESSYECNRIVCAGPELPAGSLSWHMLAIVSTSGQWVALIHTEVGPTRPLLTEREQRGGSPIILRKNWKASIAF